MSDSSSSKQAGFFRCPVQPEVAAATICIGRKRVKAMLHEQSIDGFTLMIEPKEALKLKVGTPWILLTDSERTRVRSEWMFQADNGMVQLAVRRLEDLRTAEDSDRHRWSLFTRRTRGSGQARNNELAFAGIVLLLFIVLSMPGLGDRLGTAPRIQAAVEGLLQGF
ncbi:hypothetical protein [Roseimaritima sediminicola]|uniref:hypothetical protein n=1 Tax=Roseimaritima sediminicola TaxID=2662066 RepID=UPI00129845A3|nr:hypothetical protein [Roseimaritima sediminicola]